MLITSLLLSLSFTLDIIDSRRVARDIIDMRAVTNAAPYFATRRR